MRPVLIDTDILSYFLRKDPQIVASFEKYSKLYHQLNISIITYYEVLRGLRHRDAHRKSFAFQRLIERNRVVPLTVRTIRIAADIYAETRRQGTPVDDIDILIASTAIENDWALVTHNRKHFEMIAGLEFEDWTEGS